MKKTSYKLLDDDDLTETQIYVTVQSFDRFSREYAEKWEWNPDTVKEVKKYNIQPFTKHTEKKGNVLLVGCRSGRDYNLLTNEGFSCLGIDFSYGLLSEAVKRVPAGLFIRLDPRSLPFMPESFSAIYADSLTLVPKRDIKQVLKDYSIFLKKEGILYLSLKLGEKNVLLIEDEAGKRYYTLYKKEEILKILNSVGFKVLWSQVSKCTDPVLPEWFSLVAQKNL